MCLLQLEKFGPSDPNTDNTWKGTLMFHEALYWASVTLTTVGYGEMVCAANTGTQKQ